MITVKCTCNNKEYVSNGDVYVYSRQVVEQLPAGFTDWKRKTKNGCNPVVCIDACIIAAIRELWQLGIETSGCCCGHGSMKPWVSVVADDYVRMFELGYKQKPVIVSNGVVMGVYTFYL